MPVFSNTRFPWLHQARCVVTGGAGFIGSNLSKRLLECGAKVTVIDDFSTGKRQNLAGLDVKVVEGSIVDEPLVEKTVAGHDYVFHLAAIPAVPRSLEKPLETSRANFWGTQIVLEYARRAGIKRVIYSASSSAYGSRASEEPRTEDLLPLPISPYAAQKLAGESLCRAYALSMGLDTISLRYFNIFGPKQSPEGGYAAVIPKFIVLALKNAAIPVHGTGAQSRDFTFIDNAVYANLLASNPATKMNGEVVNVGCGATFTLNHLLHEMESILGRKLRIENQAARPGDVFYSFANIDKTRRILGYEPLVSFREGLSVLIKEYLEKQQHGEL